MVAKSWFRSPQESFEAMERRLHEEARRGPPDRAPLQYAPLKERAKDDGATSDGSPDDDGGCGGDGD
jgi:hypothetical protein